MRSNQTWGRAPVDAHPSTYVNAEYWIEIIRFHILSEDTRLVLEKKGFMDEIVADEISKKPNEDTYAPDFPVWLFVFFRLLMSYIVDCSNSILPESIPTTFQETLRKWKETEQRWWKDKVQKAYQKFLPLLEAIQKNHIVFSLPRLKQELFEGSYWTIQMEPYYKTYAIRILQLW